MELEISGGKKCGSAEQLSRRWWSNEVDANREKNNTHTRKMKHITRKWKPLLYLNDTFLCSFVVNNVKHGGALLSFTLPYSPLTHSPRTHTHSFTRHINRSRRQMWDTHENVAKKKLPPDWVVSAWMFFFSAWLFYTQHMKYWTTRWSQPASQPHTHTLYIDRSHINS